ncbi:hypothetical protein, partial [Streptomyces sp. NPDC002067]
FLCACFTRLSGRFPSVLRFRLYQILSVLISADAVEPFGFSAISLYQAFPASRTAGFPQACGIGSDIPNHDSRSAAHGT